jgi:hypothetical protein
MIAWLATLSTRAAEKKRRKEKEEPEEPDGSVVEWLSHARPRGPDAKVADRDLTAAGELEREFVEPMVTVHVFTDQGPVGGFRRASESIRRYQADEHLIGL